MLGVRRAMGVTSSPGFPLSPHATPHTARVGDSSMIKEIATTIHTPLPPVSRKLLEYRYIFPIDAT